MSVLSMTKTLIKSVIHGPYTTQYPIKKKDYFEKTRGHIEIQISDCIFCSLCERRCPTGAIKVDKATGLWSIERLQCIQCNYCTEVCPKKCLRMETQYSTPAFEKGREEFRDARVSDHPENH
jgi:formate hydrogenlyase subunit 6/NADH:ubiquinone oxidoreductase subunit I